jgi:hypothetical protein
MAGNPEPLYFACWGIGAWLVARLVGMWRRQASERSARIELARTFGKIALALVLALGLAAFQVLPFLEYLEHSRVLEQRSLRQTPLDPRWWPLQIFPDALGSPAGIWRISELIPPPNYELVNMSYGGGAALFLALAPARSSRAVAVAGSSRRWRSCGSSTRTTCSAPTTCSRSCRRSRWRR